MAAARAGRRISAGSACSGEPGGRAGRVTRGCASRAGPGGEPDPAEAGTEDRVKGAGGQPEEVGAGVADDATEPGEDGEAKTFRTGASVLRIEGGGLP